MAIVIEEMRRRSSSIDYTYQPKYKRVFQAITDSPDYGPVYVRTEFVSVTGIGLGFTNNYSSSGPGGTQPEHDTAASVNSIAVDEVESDGMQWTITVDYAVWNPDTAAENPLDIPVELSVEGQVFRQICDFDIDDDPIVNTAGDPFDPAVESDQQRLVLRISQNLATFPSFAFQYANHLNEATFCGLDEKTVKQSTPQVERLYHPACGRYYRCSFLFDYDPNGWQAKPLNQGFRQIVAGNLVTIKESDGQNVSSPRPLDSSGVEVPTPAASGDVIYQAFDIYETVDFNTVYTFGTIP